MKTEAEIRKHIADLRKAIASQCGCAGTVHAIDCMIGDAQLKASRVVLSWVVEDEPRYDRTVEMLAKGTSGPQ